MHIRVTLEIALGFALIRSLRGGEHLYCHTISVRELKVHRAA